MAEHCTRTGKIRHATEGAAYAHLRSLEHDRGEIRLNVYRCAHCGCWHVGHSWRLLARDIRRALNDGSTKHKRRKGRGKR